MTVVTLPRALTLDKLQPAITKITALAPDQYLPSELERLRQDEIGRVERDEVTVVYLPDDRTGGIEEVRFYR